MDAELKQKKFEHIPPLTKCDKKDARNFRPFSVNLSVAIHNIHGHLVMDTSKTDPFPIGFTDRLCVELDKNYKETKLQLFVDPVNLFFTDSVKREYDKNLKQGHLCLSSVQLRGHAMFSDFGRMKTDTLEYAWLMEILLGNINGYITPVQTEQLVRFLDTFLNLMIEKEYSLQPVYTDRTDPGLPFKYDVTRFSIDSIDVYLVECGTALGVKLFPLRLSQCNSHTNDYEKGLSIFISKVEIKQYLNEANRSAVHTSTVTTTNTPSCSNSHASKIQKEAKAEFDDDSDASSVTISSLNTSIYSISKRNDRNGSQSWNKNENSEEITVRPFDSNDFNYWFECGNVTLGPIVLDVTLDKGELTAFYF